jgi:hypothetical protein
MAKRHVTPAEFAAQYQPDIPAAMLFHLTRRRRNRRLRPRFTQNQMELLAGRAQDRAEAARQAKDALPDYRRQAPDDYIGGNAQLAHDTATYNLAKGQAQDAAEWFKDKARRRTKKAFRSGSLIGQGPYEFYQDGIWEELDDVLAPPPAKRAAWAPFGDDSAVPEEYGDEYPFNLN